MSTVATWTPEDVANWARKVLNFAETSAKIIVEKAIDGEVLPLFESSADIVSLGIPYGSAIKLWAEIEEMKNPTVCSSKTQKIKFISDWTVEEVSNYAREQLNFDDEDLAALKNAEINGRMLLHIDNMKDLVDAQFSLGASVDLRTEIEIFKKTTCDSSTWIIERTVTTSNI